MSIGHNMPISVDNKAGSTSDVKQADFDLYRHDRRADSAIDFSNVYIGAGNVIISQHDCFRLQPKAG